MTAFFSTLIIAVALTFVPAEIIIEAKPVALKAPGIALEDINGNFTMLSTLLSGNNVVLSFWSYDCAPCRKEMPELQQMADSSLFKEKKLKVIFVYVEALTEKSDAESSSRLSKEKAGEVLQKLNIKETCLMDIYGVAFNNYRQANNIAKPTMPLLFLVNKKKDIVFSAIGYDDNSLKHLEKAVKREL
jgi:thiol-disulfide isomerase/thioredoxin